tara:strand:+ start:4581 stop:5516 length:936 start_codon:yes stop_codon:yes gene_type:complete
MTIIIKLIIFIYIFFSLSNYSLSKINFEIVMKINNEIITTFDVEQEMNYLLALNPQLEKIKNKELKILAKKSIIKEKIREIEILKYNELEIENFQFERYINNLVRSLDFSNQDEFINYLMNFNVSIDYLKKKILVENEWKSLIYAKYIDSIKINKVKLSEKLDTINKNKSLLEYNLSEIVFKKKNNVSLTELTDEIIESIQNVGFENTANLYSISESSKMGGKIGWIKRNNLSDEIINNLVSLDKNSYSKPIQIGNNYLVLKINDVRNVSVKNDKNQELEKMIMIETSKQLDKFSNIFFNKIKLNSKISEF